MPINTFIRNSSQSRLISKPGTTAVAGFLLIGVNLKHVPGDIIAKAPEIGGLVYNL
jgi:hypothetical protein